MGLMVPPVLIYFAVAYWSTPQLCPKTSRQVQAPLVDLEVRGVPALSYFGRIVWAQTLPDMAAGEHLAVTPPWQPAGVQSAHSV